MVEPNYYSYRDDAARIVRDNNGIFYRYIFNSYQAEYDHLMQSGLYLELTNKEFLIRHKEVNNDSDDSRVYKKIYPDQIEFQSYPFEWSYTQWQKSILTFLEINLIALKYGMILKEGTPFNFYLTGGKSCLFDTSSFIFFKKNDFWNGYRQFCEEFLGPFALMHFNGSTWARIMQSHLRGLPLQFVSKQLGLKSWLSLTCLVHIHFHAGYAQSDKSPDIKKRKHGFDTDKLSGLFSMIRSTVLAWGKPYEIKNPWADYYQCDIKTEDYLHSKEQLLNGWLVITTPKTIIDLGANTGKFSLLAARHAEYVIALEKDENCVDRIEREIEKSSLRNITALCCDLAETTPALGVLNLEYTSIYSRGKSEMVIGLALVHHLCIALNISMNQVAELFAHFTTNFAIVEFIPKEDDKVIELLKNRSDIFDYYHLDEFISVFSIYFNLLKVEALADSNRKMFLWQKKVSPI